MTVLVKTLINRSVNRIGAVHPSLKEYTIELIKRCYNEGIYMQISSGFRSNEDQAYIYGQGRPNYIWNGKVYGSKGSIVSNAPPGTSIHNYSILDVYNGEIVAQTIGFKQDTDFVLDTLNQLPELPEGCILHSDQGSVYTSYAYQKAVKEKGIIMSMSRKGTPADNSPIETFHSTLKTETFYLDGIYRTTNARVIQIVEEFITYYNNIRIQTKLNNQSPVQYRQLVT